MDLSVESLRKKAIALSWFTIVYNLVEGIISVTFGWTEDSISLMGFGFDSFVEVGSAIIVLWRLRGELAKGSSLSLEHERKATLGIGILFLVLALGTAGASLLQLSEGTHPETTVPGLIVSAVSLSFMFFLWKAKQRVGKALSSATVLKDADCSRACIQLSIVLFVGSLVFLIVPSLWWTDAAAGLLLAVFIAREGWETVQNARSADFDGACGCH